MEEGCPPVTLQLSSQPFECAPCYRFLCMEGAEHKNRGILDSGSKVLEQPQRCHIRYMDIIEHQHNRRMLAQPHQEGRQGSTDCRLFKGGEIPCLLSLYVQ